MADKSRQYKGIRWHIRQPDSEIVEHLQQAGGFSEPVARVLVNRGYFDMDSVDRFIQANLQMLHDPMKLDGMIEAAERTYKAIKDNERIVIYGDYDVDGVTSSALLVKILKELGAKVTFFIPNRAEHGYGLHPETIDILYAKGAKLIITVDCGISAVEAVAHANDLGIDVIITDHHEPKSEKLESEYDITDDLDFSGSDEETKINNSLPKACAVINPKLGHYPFSGLAGVGVAFKFAHGLIKFCREKNFEKAHTTDLRNHLDLVALGTIADSVPLRDENRILVKHGLSTLKNSKKVGIQALIKVSKTQNVNVRSVAFGLAPRINAAGRLGDANDAVKLLLTESFSEAEDLAEKLDKINLERQKVERETFDKAKKMFESGFDVELPVGAKLAGGLYRYIPDCQKAIVLAGENWNPGVVGIVASRMVDRYYLPTVIISMDGNNGRGSCRSTRDFHIFDALSKCGDLLERFGGHKVAAGLSISKEKIDVFREEFCKIADEELDSEGIIPVQDVDAEIELRDCDIATAEQLDSFMPFGQNNPRPVFAVKKVKLVEIPRIIKEKHLKFCVMQYGEYRKIIAFNWADRLNEIQTWAEMDILIQPYLNYYRGAAELEFQLIDAKETLWIN